VTAADAPRLDRSIEATGCHSLAPVRGGAPLDESDAEAGTIANSSAATRVISSSTETAETLPIAVVPLRRG
jgi:hypothetical protein